MAGAAFTAALVAAGAVVLLTRDDGPSHPSTWDPRVADLVSVVEEEKGATFEHPVRVVFLGEDEFDERVSVDEELTDEEREELERSEATLRALGLHGGTGSLLDQVDTFQTEAIAAFYDPDREEIVIPDAGESNLASKATLVHELTHALQDQLGQIEDLDDSEAAAGLDALVEGEASHVEDAWSETLSEDDLQLLDEQEAGAGDDAAAGIEDLNPAMVAIFGAPYTMGRAMVEALDGANQLDDAFEDPPNSSADVLEPARWLDPVETIDVEAPRLSDDEEQQGTDGPLGAHMLYLMLAGALEPKDALAAAGGWGGDQLRSYRDSDGTDCVRVALVGVDAAATSRLAEAVDSWVASRPDGVATASEVDGHVQFDACDPGAVAETLTIEVAGLPEVRADLISVFVDAGADMEVATCAATEVVDRVPLELLTADELTKEQEEELGNTMLDVRTTCLG